ncbi:hypothetical protein ACFVFF_23080 [Streptomyces sp. NPDC057680]|uniref:hypothetical protein n=1 Tax=Streptomyces sp. NPDC057680 TaxID=3346208 RepID=UPI0036A24389
MTTDREPPNHTTLTCYTRYRCRLPECVERKRAWARNREQSIKAGTWQPLIDATPVREHLTKLMEEDGVTQQAIADTLGVPHTSLADFTHHRGKRRGMRHRTDPALAAQILALDAASVTAGRVSATGAHRRIQALVAMGWPLLHIGRQTGMGEQRPEQILAAQRIYAATRTQLYAGYDRIQNMRPERNGVPPWKARHARSRAAANRWPNPAYWADRMDVIDDPDFEPLYGVTKRELVAQDANWVMRTTGVDRATAAARLGVSKAYVEHAFRDHPEYALGTAA